MLYIGLVAGTAAGNAAAHASGVDAFRVFLATMILIVPALVGARLLYVALHWGQYRNDTRRVWNRDEGGLAMYGGLPIMLLLSAPVLLALGLDFGAFWDAAVFTVMAGMFFTKIGCFLNGCCAGRPSESWLSVHSPGRRGVWAKRIPVQCLEAAWAAVLLVFAFSIQRRLPFPGALFLVVAIGYACGRLAFESLRERDSRGRGVSLGQAASAATIVVSATMLMLRWPN